MLLGICIIILLWFAVSYWQMQQAMRWWFKQETIERAAQADQIQNGLIQDLFAIRLSLQSLLLDPTEVKLQQQVCLTKAEAMHHSLLDLSALATRPYLAENLALAIQSFLQQWQSTHTCSQLQLDLPSSWRTEPPEQNRVILATLEILLKIALLSALPETQLQVSLSRRSYSSILSIKITYSDPSDRIAATRARELNYLYRCFRCLTLGWCRYQYHLNESTWQFHWRHPRRVESTVGD